jgi:hypothetical protein
LILVLVGGMTGVAVITGGHALTLAAEIRELRATLVSEEAPPPGEPASDGATSPERGDLMWRMVRDEYRHLARETGDGTTFSEWSVRLLGEGSGRRVVLAGTARDGRTLGKILRRWQPPPGEGAMEWEESPAASGDGRRFTLTIYRGEGVDHGEP